MTGMCVWIGGFTDGVRIENLSLMKYP